MSGSLIPYRFSTLFFLCLRSGIFFISVLILFSACGTTKYLGPDQVFLKENDIELKTDQQIKKKGALKYELATLYKQKPNTNFFFIPREWYYYQAQDTTGRSKFTKGFKRWMMRQFGEEPVFYDAEKTEATERSMEYYLQHQGYFLAKVQSYYEYTDRKNQKVAISYEVRPRDQYLIDTVRFISRDSEINRILHAISGSTVLKKGSPVDVDLYEQESARIVSYLRNQGYAYFGSNFINNLEADSSNFRAKLTLEVLLPPNDSIHRTYSVGDVYIYPNYNPSAPVPAVIDTIGSGVYLVTDEEGIRIKEKTLLNSIFLKKGELFRQDNYDRTNRQLSNLGIFRFVTIKGEPDPDIPGRINYRIYLTPSKRFDYGTNIEVNTYNTNVFSAPQQLLGVSGNVFFRHRNVFKGAELLITNLEGGVDLNLNRQKQDTVDLPLINTVDLRLQSDLYFPKFIDFFGAYSLLDKWRILRRPFYSSLVDRGATRLSLSYNYLERISLFTLNTMNASFGYDFSPSRRHRYIINHLGIDYLSPKTTQYFFDLILKDRESLRRSFEKQLFTGFLLRDFNYTYTGSPNLFGESHSFIARLELSGLEVCAANLIYNGLAGKQDTFKLVFQGEDIQFSQYARTELDYRHYRQLSKGQFFVFRASVGLAAPYGFSSSVPFVKQFSAGGPQSVRAWRAREIGPGGYRDTLTKKSDTNPTLFYQTGEFKLDLNLEYRFPIFTLFGIKYEGALFLDAGNVWTTRQDPSRVLSQLRWTPTYDEKNRKISDNLFKYMAVGTGFGLRLDFTYFILRLDLGLKLRNPYPKTDEQGYILEEVFWELPFKDSWRDVNLNLGLGYPF